MTNFDKRKLKRIRMQSMVERLRGSPGAGSLGSSSFVAMLDNFRRSFGEERPEGRTKAGDTTVSSTQENANGNLRDVVGFSRMNTPSNDGSFTLPVRGMDARVDVEDFEIATVESATGGSILRVESTQLEELVTANQRLQEELQRMRNTKKLSEDSFREEISQLKLQYALAQGNARDELAHTRQELSSMREEYKKMLEDMKQLSELNESDAPARATEQETIECDQTKQVPLAKFINTDVVRYNGEATTTYSVHGCSMAGRTGSSV